MVDAGEWNIETELEQISGAQGIVNAVRALGLLAVGCDEVAVDVVRDWHRSGAETYAFVFRLRSGPTASPTLILKAMVAATPGVPPLVQQRRRLARRRLLAEQGCMVPALFGEGKGVYLEEYVGTDLTSTGVTMNNTVQSCIAVSLAAIATCNFRPLSLVPNFVASQSAAYWVDYGTDLGDPSAESTTVGALARQFIHEFFDLTSQTIAQSTVLGRLALNA